MYLIMMRCGNENDRASLRNVVGTPRTYFSKKDAGHDPKKDEYTVVYKVR